MSVHNSTFKFRSVREFRDVVGKVNAVISFTELAVRNLRNQYTATGQSHQFLSKLSTELGVYVTHVPLDLLSHRTSQLHTVSMFQSFEAFLRELKTEHPASDGWEPRKEEESLLEYMMRNVTGRESGWDASTKLELDLLEYYRLARNYFLHSSKQKPTKAKDLKERARNHESFQKLDAPNIFNELSFDDCVVCARSALLVAEKMSAWGRPSDSEIATMVFRMEENGAVNLANLRAARHDRQKCERKVQHFLSSMYGMSSNESTGVIGYIVERLLA